MPPKKLPVWEHFEKRGDSILCKFCNKLFKNHQNTSNMRQHLKAKHPHALLGEIQGQEVPNPNGSSDIEAGTYVNVPSSSCVEGEGIENAGTVENPSASNPNAPLRAAKRPRQLKLYSAKNSLSTIETDSIHESLIKMVVKDLQPLSIVENAGFVEYSRKLQPLYKIPSRKTLSSQLLPKFYNKVIFEIKNMLNEIKYVAITTDLWSSDNNKSFMCLTCHYIYNNTLKSSVLETRELPGSHTGENIAAALHELFTSWGLVGKIVAAITDNGANIKHAVNDYLHVRHIPCVAHTLNLCVSNSLDNNQELQQILKKCKTVVTHFKSSNKASDKLREIQNQMNMPSLKVKQDVPTRWNSILIMIKRLSDIRTAISAALSYLPAAPENLDSHEWEILNDCVLILEPVMAMTEELSGDQYPTLSMVLPILRGLQYTLKKLAGNTNVGNKLKNDLMDALGKRFVSEHWERSKLVAKATFLDPRFKKAAFGTEENAENAQKWVTAELEAMLKSKSMEQLSTSTSSSSNELDHPYPSTSTGATSKAPQNILRTSLWECFDNKLKEKQTTCTSTSNAIIMVKQYLELPYEDRWKNPMPFCAKYKSLMPELYELQLKYLCLPATSVPSERVFSKAGQVANQRRNRLSSKNINYILFLNSNM